MCFVFRATKSASDLERIESEYIKNLQQQVYFLELEANYLYPAWSASYLLCLLCRCLLVAICHTAVIFSLLLWIFKLRLAAVLIHRINWNSQHTDGMLTLALLFFLYMISLLYWLLFFSVC